MQSRSGRRAIAVEHAAKSLERCIAIAGVFSQLVKV
jgi:hypothetical protein